VETVENSKSDCGTVFCEIFSGKTIWKRRAREAPQAVKKRGLPVKFFFSEGFCGLK